MHFKTTESGATAHIRTGKTDTARDGKAAWEEQAVHTATKGKECNYKRKWAVAGYPGG